jgi:hypothetical protein
MSNENTMLAIKAFEVTQHDLSEINTENLISGFDSVGEQTQLLRGKILLEIRKRCYHDGKTLKDLILSLGIKHSSLLELSPAQRNRLMNLAEFFNDERPMSGISVTVDEIKVFIGIFNDKKETTKLKYATHVTLSEDAKKILEHVNSLNLNGNAAIKALKECYTKMIEAIDNPPIDSTASSSIAENHC